MNAKDNFLLELANSLPNTNWLTKSPDVFVDRCFAGDVVINIGEVSSERRAYINNTIDEISKVNEAVCKDKTLVVLAKLEGIRNNTVKPLVPTLNLDDFQIKQIEINPDIFFYELVPNIRYGKNKLESMIVHNFVQQTLKTINVKPDKRFYNPITYSTREYMDFDRNGAIFSALRDHLMQSATLPNDIVYVYGEKKLYAELARYRQDNELEIAKVEAIGKQILVKRNLYGKETSQTHRYYKCKGIDQVPIKFNEIYKELTNKDFVANVKFPPSDDNQFFGHFELITQKRYRIPPLKQMCFSVLSELYLINKIKFGESINQLTQDVLGQYLTYCFQDEKPLGGEVALFLRSFLKSSYSENVLDELFPFQLYIESMFNRHTWIFKTLVHGIPQSLIKPPYDCNLLINVYDNTQLFKPKQIPKANLLFEQKIHSDPLTLQPKQVFIENFNKNTGGFFDDFNFDNVVVIGGIMTSSLTGETTGFEQSDIDICFYGLSCVDIKKRVIEIITKANEKYSNTSLALADNDLIYCRHFPHRHIQFNCTTFKNIQEVLIGVDIEASCFAFDGTNIWTTQRGVEAFNYRTNFATPYGHYSRGEDQYQRRLLKYLDRGFNIAYLPNDIIEEGVKNMNYGKYSANGIELLFKAKGNASIMEALVKKSKKGSLPYGPNIDKRVFDNIVQENYDQNFDGYNSCDWPQLSELSDIEDDFEPDLDLETSAHFHTRHFYHFTLNDSDYDYELFDEEVDNNEDEDDEMDE